MTWNAAHEATLDSLSNEIVRNEAARLATVSPEDASILSKLRTLTSDVTCIGLTFLIGFEWLIQDVDVPTSHQVPAVPALKAWAKTMQRHRSAWTIGSMSSASLCALLEGFMDEMGRRHVNASTVARVRARGRELDADDTKAQKQLRGWLRPSGAGGGMQWLGRVRDTFETVIDPAVAETLFSMIDVRNAFAHQSRPDLGAEYPAITGEELKSWSLAVLVLAYEIVGAVSRAPA